ncbi:MAG: hypothetical protein JRN66_08905 [Nitrososphaerota archaeon]|nr:hypothetical protein [Nitrososphaerota archaeon]
MNPDEIKELKHNVSKSVEMSEAYKIHVEKILSSVSALQLKASVGVRLPNMLGDLIKADELFMAPDGRIYLLGSETIDSIELKSLPSDLIMRVINEALPLLSAAVKRKEEDLARKVNEVEEIQAQVGDGASSSSFESKDLMESALK